MINLKHSIICAFLLFQTHTKNWEGTDTPGRSFAKFESFTGTQDFKVKLDKNASFSFKYKTILDGGSMHLEVKSKSKTILSKDLEGSQEGMIEVLNPRREQYTFVFKAKNAGGSFDVSYKLSKP